MIELNFRATPLLKAHKQLDCTNCAQISEIWCNINYSACLARSTQLLLPQLRNQTLSLALLAQQCTYIQITQLLRILSKNEHSLTIWLQLSRQNQSQLSSVVTEPFHCVHLRKKLYEKLFSSQEKRNPFLLVIYTPKPI